MMWKGFCDTEFFGYFCILLGVHHPKADVFVLQDLSCELVVNTDKYQCQYQFFVCALTLLLLLFTIHFSGTHMPCIWAGTHSCCCLRQYILSLPRYVCPESSLCSFLVSGKLWVRTACFSECTSQRRKTDLEKQLNKLKFGYTLCAPAFKHDWNANLITEKGRWEGIKVVDGNMHLCLSY